MNGASIPSRTFVPRRSVAQRWALTVFLVSCFSHSWSATHTSASVSWMMWD